MNKSSIYGYYGGVSQQNHYVPPGAEGHDPSIFNRAIFTKQDQVLVQQLIQQTEFYAENAPNIVVRTNVSSLPGNVDTFVLTTSANPQDVIQYTSNEDIVALNVVDGGVITPSELNGGEF